jgi:hypothetical protein
VVQLLLVLKLLDLQVNSLLRRDSIFSVETWTSASPLRLTFGEAFLVRGLHLGVKANNLRLLRLLLSEGSLNPFALNIYDFYLSFLCHILCFHKCMWLLMQEVRTFQAVGNFNVLKRQVLIWFFFLLGLLLNLFRLQRGFQQMRLRHRLQLPRRVQVAQALARQKDFARKQKGVVKVVIRTKLLCLLEP